MKPCFGSPTTFNPAAESPCRGCPHFSECGLKALAKVRAFARSAPLADLAEYLESELKRAGAIPAGKVGDRPAQVPEELVELTVGAPRRSFDRISRQLLDEEREFLGRLPVKVADRLRPMLKRGTFREIKDGLAVGVNRFPTSALPYLHLGAELLLAGGRLPKAALRVAFMQRFGWTEGTAFSRVAITSRVLLEFGAARDDGHTLTHTPKT